MPATLNHIKTNLERIESGDSAKLKQIKAAAERDAKRDATDGNEPDLQFVWRTIVTEAEKADIGEQIPGTVGREFAKAKGLIQARPARGERQAVSLTPAAAKAVEAYRKSSDQVRVEAGELVFTNLNGAVKAVEAMIKRAQSDDETDAKEAAGARNALKALLKKVAPSEDGHSDSTE